MTLNDYHRRFCVLGKLCRMYDIGGSDPATLRLLIARLYDQVATGETDTLGGLMAIAGHARSLYAAVGDGFSEYQRQAVEAARAYLVSEYFIAGLTTVPVAPITAKTVLEAWQVEMNEVDDEIEPSPPTMTNESATGLVHFFAAAFGPSGEWPTVAPGDALFDDSVYVNNAIVAD